MLSRALSLATVMLLIGCLAAIPVRAENLDAGKSPSQIFAGTCNACHKSPRGLLKTVPASSLPGFLRQHYTTSSEMAGVLASFLVSNGAADPRYQAKQDQAKPGKDAKPGAEPQHAARPDADGPGAHPGRNAKRAARPGEAPDAAKPAADGQQQPAQATLTTGPDGRKSAAKQKLGKKGKPGSEEPPKSDAAKEEAAKGEAAKEDTPKSDTAKDEAAKPSAESKSETAKVDAQKETGGATPVLRPDPVPPVTPAPPAEAPSASAAVSSGSSEPAAAPAQPAAPPAPPPAVTASAPALPPVPPAGPPAPPISQ
ncbi:hypothetical protein KMZ93_16210 [Bradyrhizobium sediminis]|uniref:Cytochrome c domain-containing protein n=1 Tax=Bradyrhizobium sediminis TaxID=2840469 RepID=A0A975NV45_9BRAD|nr:hypothetical protein [Bradyrhizobium sediminis]QWG21545.1 hypothetical protein KMZ93_16210 [Bradyrhizobium sediminis]